MIDKKIKVFISYSHVDQEIAIRIAESLRQGGIDVWIDKYEIIAGDSLIKKIFSEGLSGADVFLIILTENSVKSNWVNQELDLALIKKIEGITRIIPITYGQVSIPEPLQTLKWIDMTTDFDKNLRELIKAIYQIKEKPPLGSIPDFISKNLSSVGGLSRLATSMGYYLLHSGREETGDEENYRESDLAEKLGFTPEEADDAVDELKSLGLVKTYDYFGSGPYSHSEVEPTYALFLHFKNEGLSYDPEKDIKAITSAVVAEKQLEGSHLMELTGLTPLRINRAVGYIEDYGIAQVEHEIGTDQFNFGFISATGNTRRFVERNCN